MHKSKAEKLLEMDGDKLIQYATPSMLSLVSKLKDKGFSYEKLYNLINSQQEQPPRLN